MTLTTDKIKHLIQVAEIENRGSAPYGFLPEIIITLRSLLIEIEKEVLDEATAKRTARGLGRLVTEDIGFSESRLGGELLDLVDQLSQENRKR